MKNARAVTRRSCCRGGDEAPTPQSSACFQVSCACEARACHTCTCAHTCVPNRQWQTPDTFIGERRGSTFGRQDGTDRACELKISCESFAWLSFSPSSSSLSLLPLATAQQSEGQTNMFTPRAVSFHISIRAALEVADLNGGTSSARLLYVSLSCWETMSPSVLLGALSCSPFCFPLLCLETPIIRASAGLLTVKTDFLCNIIKSLMI